MKKILTFIINENKEILLLKGNPKNPQFHKSFWYTVTGGYEEKDITLKNTVIREVKEETNLEVDTYNIIDLNWKFEYESLGEHCVEYAYISYVKKGKIMLNEENIEYKWCNIDDFIKEIKWWSSKKELRKRLTPYVVVSNTGDL